MPRKIILLEVNEIPYRVIDDFIAQHPRSRLAREFARCSKYMTITTDTGHLSPWVTWPTLHRGVNNEVHKLSQLGQDASEIDRHYPPIWQILADAGFATGIFGPLHSWPLPADAGKYSFYLPDTFAQTPESHPDDLTAYQNFNLVMARQSPRNVSGGVDAASLLAFMLKAPSLGVRLRTLRAIARQLIAERREGWKRTRRRTYQPVLAFDLFMKQLDQHKPDFSNFFTNHVASAMHRYWAAVYPEDYDEIELGPKWQAKYGGEIDFAMGWLDIMFDRLASFVDHNPDYLLVVASSMGQAAMDGGRVETQLYLREPAKLMRRAGLQDCDWEQRPAMDPRISLVVSEDKMADFATFLNSLTIQDAPLRWNIADTGNGLNLIFGHRNIDITSERACINGVPVDFADLGIEAVRIEDEAGSTAYHIPEGTLFIYDPLNESTQVERPVTTTTQLAPAILKQFGIEVPDYMEKKGALKLC
jgi:hypothetical protein